MRGMPGSGPSSMLGMSTMGKGRKKVALPFSGLLFGIQQLTAYVAHEVILKPGEVLAGRAEIYGGGGPPAGGGYNTGGGSGGGGACTVGRFRLTGPCRVTFEFGAWTPGQNYGGVSPLQYGQGASIWVSDLDGSNRTMVLSANAGERGSLAPFLQGFGGFASDIGIRPGLGRFGFAEVLKSYPGTGGAGTSGSTGTFRGGGPGGPDGDGNTGTDYGLSGGLNLAAGLGYRARFDPQGLLAGFGGRGGARLNGGNGTQKDTTDPRPAAIILERS